MRKLALTTFSTTSIAASIILFSFIFTNAIANEVTDSETTAKLKTLLAKEPDIPANDIKITTNNGVVSLAGEVETTLQAGKIISIANSVNNVKEVDTSQLKTVSSNQYMKDTFITAAAKGKIMKLIKNEQINKNCKFHVETTNGIVHVLGLITPEVNKMLKFLIKNCVGLVG